METFNPRSQIVIQSVIMPFFEQDSGIPIQMQKFLSFVLPACLALSSLSLTGCAFPGVYKIDIQQGNIITQDMLDQLKPGMTRRQVHYVLGNPVIEPAFDPALESYVYSIQREGGEIKQQVIKVYYENDLMTRYSGTLLPSKDTGLTSRPSRERPIFDDRPTLPE